MTDFYGHAHRKQDIETGNALPSTAYVAGFLTYSSTLPARDGTNITEPTGGGFVRPTVSSATFALAGATTDGQVRSGAIITNVTSTGAWSGGASFPYAVLMASDGTTPMKFGTLNNAITVSGAGVIVTHPIGDINWTNS